MTGIFNRDFVDFIKALNAAKVRYILVGGYAVILHGYHRATGDLDVWVEPTQENFMRLQQAFMAFGLPVHSISEKMFLDTENYDVFTFGVPPVSIDLLTKVKGLTFKKCYNSSTSNETQGVSVRLLHLSNLIDSKRAAGRYKDLADIEHLEQE